MYGMLRSSHSAPASFTSMDISTFITRHMEHILVEWEEFATSFGAVADKMSSHELRDHAQQILEFVARDIREEESADDAEHKSRGHHAADDDSASSLHGKLRYASGFTLLQLIAEYRALRASVLKLWQQDGVALTRHSAQDIVRFNEAIDQSLADAAVAYSDKVNETRDIFLAILGHDLRSPLAATATAGAYLARPGVFDERVTQIGVRLKRSAATMNSMVNDLLGLARTQLGDGIPMERRACDLREMAGWAIEDAQAAHPRAIFAFQADGDITGAFDGPRLQQLLTNLANNAAQYGKPGAPITVELTGDAAQVLLKVRNEGAVISPELLPTLFSSLVQLPAQEGDSRPRSSLGLGLFIACQIAVAHGGTIDVVSDAQSGTVFTVAIPRH
jgi:signal transduction histidine kinase